MTRVIDSVSDLVGSRAAAIAAGVLVVAALIGGALFHFSHVWELVVEVSATLITFLIVVAIQHTQSRETRATQIKLDEVIRSLETARNELVHAERGTHQELDRLDAQADS